MRTLLPGLLLLLLPAALRAQVAALVIGHGSPQRIEQATAVAEVLRAVAPDATVRLLVGAEATSASVRGALFQLMARRPSDVLVYAATDVTLQRYPSGGETGWLLLEGSRPADQPSEVPESALGLQPVVAQMAASTARRVVLALDTRFAGLAVPAAPVTPDTFLAAIAGSTADAFPLGQAIYAANSYPDAITRLLGVEAAIRLSLQPARSIARTLRTETDSATLVLPALSEGIDVTIDGENSPSLGVRDKDVSLYVSSLGPGDHTVAMALNDTPLWSTAVVLAAGERRLLAEPVEAQHPVRLVPDLHFPASRLLVNGVVIPLQDTIRVAPGFLSLAAEQPQGILRTSNRFAPGSVVRLQYTTHFSPGTALSGILAPGLVQFRQGARLKGAAMLGAVLVGAGTYLYGKVQSQTARQRYTSAQLQYNLAEGESATREARVALDSAYDEARQAHTLARWAGTGFAVALTLNVVDVLTFHSRPPRIALVPQR